ncbi:MAG: uroporphyrinogen decarboxylase family protein [Phycisphaerae bacterium]
MSFEDGWAAINLQMPKRVPRTEYSAEMHFDLIKAVTGISVEPDSPEADRIQAGRALRRAWNYDVFWNVLIFAVEFGSLRTDMGHAEYAAAGTDRRDTVSCPFQDPEDVLRFDPWQAYGRKDKAEMIRRFEGHYQANCTAEPTGVNMTGIYVTCISGLIDIFGWDMLLEAAGLDPVRFGDLTNRYCTWIGQYFQALAESNVPVVMIHDDIVWTSGAIFKPDWYRTYVFPNFKKMFAPILDRGKRLLFTSDGTYTEFFDDLAACGVHGFCLEPTNDMTILAEKYGKTHVIVGNADTRILLSGPKSKIRAEVERCMQIGKKCPGYFMNVGNHIPPNTPVENALYYNQVYEELSKR